MAQVDRFSVSLDTELLAAFDRHIASRGYENRSEAIRDLLRDLIASDARVQGNHEATAVLVCVCDNRVTEAARRLRSRLASHRHLIGGTLHVSIDEENEQLAIVLQGPADALQTFSDGLLTLRGVTQGHLCWGQSKT